MKRAEQTDGPKRWIGRVLMESLLATARSSAVVPAVKTRDAIIVLPYSEPTVGLVPVGGMTDSYTRWDDRLLSRCPNRHAGIGILGMLPCGILELAG